MENKKGLSFKQYLILAVVSITLFVALWNFKETWAFISLSFGYTLPLFIGACIAFVINVPTKAFERGLASLQRKWNLKVRHTMNTYIGLVLTLLCLSGAIAIFVNFIAPQLGASVTDIFNRFKKWYPAALEFLKNHDVDVSILKKLDINKITEYVKNYLSFDNTMGVINTVVSTASSTVSVIFSAISCIVFSIYMITGKKRLNHQARKLIYAYLPKRFADKACHVGSLFYKTFYNFVSSQCVDALILALILYLALRIFRIPYAGVICIVTGFLALIPYVGATVSCILGALLILIVSPFKSLIFVVIFLVVQQIEGQLIYPHLVGSSIGLPAIWTLFAALVGGSMMGLFGVVFFIPLTAVIYTLIKEGTAKRLTEKEIVVETAEAIEEREMQQRLEEKLEEKERKKEQKQQKKQAKAEKKNKKHK